MLLKDAPGSLVERCLDRQVTTLEDERSTLDVDELDGLGRTESVEILDAIVHFLNLFLLLLFELASVVAVLHFVDVPQLVLLHDFLEFLVLR